MSTYDPNAQKSDGDIDSKEQQRSYRCFTAVHYEARTSQLGHDSKTIPSFVGFRNLMVLALGMLASLQSSRSETQYANGVPPQTQLL